MQINAQVKEKHNALQIFWSLQENKLAITAHPVSIELALILFILGASLMFLKGSMNATLKNEGIEKAVKRPAVFLFFFAWIFWHYLFAQCPKAAFVLYWNVYLLQFCLLLVISFYDFCIKTTMDNQRAPNNIRDTF